MKQERYHRQVLKLYLIMEKLMLPDRYLKIYNIKKYILFKNINQFSLIKTKKINYEKSFRNLIDLLNKSKHNPEGFITNDKKIYKVLKKLI